MYVTNDPLVLNIDIITETMMEIQVKAALSYLFLLSILRKVTVTKEEM